MKKRKTSGKLGVSRRDFLRNAGAGLMAAELAGASPGKQQKPAAPPAPVHFTPQGGLTQISPNLYVLRDTCNVYVLKDGDRAILIDFGSGHVLNLLGQIGVSKVEAVLHTHHHRDQCQGDSARGGRAHSHHRSRARAVPVRGCRELLAESPHFRNVLRQERFLQLDPQRARGGSAARLRHLSLGTL